MAHPRTQPDPKPPEGVHYARALPYKTVRNLNDTGIIHTVIYLMNQAKRVRRGYRIAVVAPDHAISRRVSEALTMHQLACRVDDLAPRGHVSIRFEAPEGER